MNTRLSKNLFFLLSFSVLFAFSAEMAEAKRQSSKSRRRSRTNKRRRRRKRRRSQTAKRKSGDYISVALVYRKDVSQFVDLVREFKKKAPYKFLDLGFSPRSKTELQRTKNRLEKGGIDGGLFVGPASLLLLKKTKNKPRRIVSVVVDPTVKAPNLISMGPSPQAVINKMRQVCRKKIKTTLITSSRSSSYAKAFAKAAKKNRLRFEIFEATSPRQTILALTKRSFAKNETITLAPGTKSLISPVLKTLVFLERLREVPIFSFCRRHVTLGVFMGFQRSPSKTATLASERMKSLLERKSKKRDQKASTAPKGRPNAGDWYYNPTVAAHLKIPKGHLERSNVSQVSPETGKKNP